MEDYVKKIRKLVAEKAGVEVAELNFEDYIEDDLNIGEMELIELLEEIEETFHVELLENKGEIETVQDLVDFVSEQVE